MFTKDQIIDEIRRTAGTNGAEALGRQRFEKETGIRPVDWRKHWVRWSDAVEEAGYTCKSLQTSRDEGEPLGNLANLARERGRFPVGGEIDLRARSAPGLPWNTTYRQRFGSSGAIARRLREFSAERGWDDVVAMCDAKIATTPSSARDVADFGDDESATLGYVYLMKSGRNYKIGRSNAVGRRGRELQIQLPEKAEVVHEIKADDPVGIENYWHNRFADRRKNGEWFELTAKDVATFKRRKFM